MIYAMIFMYLWAGITNYIWHYEKYREKGIGDMFSETRVIRTIGFTFFVMLWPLTPVFWFFEWDE